MLFYCYFHYLYYCTVYYSASQLYPKKSPFENKPFIHSFIHLFIHSFIHSFIQNINNLKIIYCLHHTEDKIGKISLKTSHFTIFGYMRQASLIKTYADILYDFSRIFMVGIECPDNRPKKPFETFPKPSTKVNILIRNICIYYNK